MKTYNINTKDIKNAASFLKTGDRVLLSGVVYTARDAAHKRIVEMIEKGVCLPFDLNDAVIYYAGPTPLSPDSELKIGCCGPTTSGRMNKFSPTLLDNGLGGIIGKGKIGDNVCKKIVENKAVYLCALGGLGALAAACVKKCDVIAFEELGCEAIRRLEIENFPLIVGVDAFGGNIYSR